VLAERLPRQEETKAAFLLLLFIWAQRIAGEAV